MKFKRLLAAGLASMMAVGLLAGCGSGSDSGNNSQQGASNDAGGGGVKRQRIIRRG